MSSGVPDGELRRQLARVIAAGRVDEPLAQDLLEFARAEGVLPLLEWLRAGVAPLRAQAAVQLARRARLSRVLDLLAVDGVGAIVFKGAHLAYTCYPDPALRPHVDTDILIRPGDVEAARRSFERSGHRLLPHVSGRFVTSQFHYVDGDTGGAHAYDVHWQMANPIAFHDLLPYDEVRAQAVRLEPFGAHGLGPSVPHALLMACMHRAAHHSGSERLIWLTDLRLLLRAATRAQADEFCRLADITGLNAVCHDACARAADLFGDMIVPARLRSRAAASAEPTRAYLTTLSPLKKVCLDFRTLRGWKARAALLREHLFPPSGYLQASPGWRGPLPWRYATRIVRGAARYVRPLLGSCGNRASSRSRFGMNQSLKRSRRP